MWLSDRALAKHIAYARHWVRSPAPYSEDLARRGDTYHRSRGRRMTVLGAAVVVYTLYL